jgi:hypothetical protein
MSDDTTTHDKNASEGEPAAIGEPEPTLDEQLRAAEARAFEAELAAARAGIKLELAEAVLRAAQAEARATYAERRLDELNAALGRQQDARHAATVGIARFRGTPE